MRSLASGATVLALLVQSAACSSAGDLPLGGPYGGYANSDGTNAGTGSGSGTSGSNSSAIVVIGSNGESSTTVVITSGGSSSSSTVTTTSSSEESSSTSSSAASSSSTTTASSSSSTAAPTWTYLYTTYLASGSTPGDCDGSCHHHSQCSSASACYSWIGNGNYDLSSSGNLFCWDSNGFMPIQCPSYGNAIADFAAWIAAGSKNN